MAFNFFEILPLEVDGYCAVDRFFTVRQKGPREGSLDRVS